MKLRKQPIVNMSEINEFKKTVCCITGKRMSTSKNVNVLALPFKAKWKFPVWGNVLTGEENRAIAIFHDDALTEGRLVGQPKTAVELRDGKVIHHPLEELEPAEEISNS